MSGSRHDADKLLFLRARELPPQRRRDFVLAECDGDEARARAVLDLLEIDAELPGAAGDDADPAGDARPAIAADPWLGRELGGYVLLERIGAGGMGVVYAAEQRQPRRRVALKLLRSIVATPAVMRRFAAESGLLARLSHPHIAQVFAAGTFDVDGRPVPWFSMELVAGARSIVRFCDDEALALPARIELLARVCDAVHHGHTKGVIHRDLKPENILVDRAGNPKLIDFGVARVVDTGTLLGTLHTLPGQLLGTLQYMCPEQCDGAVEDLDTRGDVYSLGAVLYELVTGSPPLDLSRDTLLSATRRIREEAPRPPSRVRDGVPRGLDVVASKALAKRRDDRYASAAALAGDLRAFLDGRPILAAPPSAWSRAAAWIAHHPIWTTAALCAGIALVSLTTVWLVARRFTMLPDRLTIDASMHFVRLESRGGTELFAWHSMTPVQSARLVSIDTAYGGERVAMLVYFDGVAEDPRSGNVCCYPIDPPAAEPLWTTAVELEPFAKVAREHPRLAPRVEFVLTQDLIADVPGTEFLVAQTLRPGDYSALRVFDRDGRLRYATWHVGALHSAARVLGRDRVVVAGLNSAHAWHELGSGADEWPSVVFAIDVRDGHRGPVGGIVERRALADPTVAWYRWLGPADVVAPVQSIRLSASTAYGAFRDRHVDVTVSTRHGREQTALLAIVLDAEGREVHRAFHDAFARERARGLPDLALARLLDLAELPEPGGDRATEKK